MPIYTKQKNQAEQPGSLLEDTSKIKQFAVLLQQQLQQTVSRLRQLKFEKVRLEQEVARKDSEIKYLKQQLQKLSRNRSNGESQFGDF